jgi:hypothetical protein
MSKSTAADIREDFEAAHTYSHACCADHAKPACCDAEAAIGKAATEVTRAAGRLRERALATAKGAASQATKELKEHPLVALTAAVAAGATVVGILAATHRRSS